MKFTAIDTSGKYLSVVAYNEGKAEKIFLEDCAMKHSVVLMDRIGEAFSRAQMSPQECDFFAVVVGPGSFTGIRIGISTVKGLCFACDRPALAVTSFDCIAYNEERQKKLALVDAGRGELYACRYDGKERGTPAILSAEQVMGLVKEGYVPLSAEQVPVDALRVDPCEGLLRAVCGRAKDAAPASGLHALYLRKSSAEENRK